VLKNAQYNTHINQEILKDFVNFVPSLTESKDAVNYYTQVEEEYEEKFKLEYREVFNHPVKLFYPIVNTLIRNTDKSISKETTALLTLATFAVLFGESKQESKKIFEELRLRGVYDYIAKIRELLLSFVALYNLFDNHHAKEIKDVFAKENIITVLLENLGKLIKKYNFNIDMFNSAFNKLNKNLTSLDGLKMLKELIKKLDLKNADTLDHLKIDKNKIKKFDEFDEEDVINENDY
jgi:hypothetical protein